MACGCRNKQKRTNIDFVINLATILSKTIKLDTMVFKEGLHNSQLLYNFAPYSKNKKDIIEIIRWQVKE